MQSDLNTTLAEHLKTLDIEQLKRDFVAQDEFVLVPDFLPPATLDALLGDLPALEPVVHRNFIPKHKKGGSVSRFDLDRTAPRYGELYQAGALMAFMSALCGRELSYCPPGDPHTYALYYYTEPGDHIGYHYDTSYYDGARYTILIGLVAAPSCRLECQLHTKNPAVETSTVSVNLEPGMFVMFNGDKLYHRITPLAADERRVALTLEYLTSTHMNPVLRFVSNMKDAIAYFGFRQVFSRDRHNPGP